MKQPCQAHQSMLPVLFTCRYAVDYRVVKMMRVRSLGNSPTQLQRKLAEFHGEKWLTKSAQYFEHVQSFKQAQDAEIVTKLQVKELPAFVDAPSAKWLLTVHCQGVINTRDKMKVSITSCFCEILNLDSTKKLADDAAGTYSWATNVRN